MPKSLKDVATSLSHIGQAAYHMRRAEYALEHGAASSAYAQLLEARRELDHAQDAIPQALIDEEEAK